jgi:hypothetical protein
MIEKELPPDGGGSNLCCLEKFFMGFKECQEEVLQYLIETEGVTQWPKEKGQKDKQRSTKHYTEN